MLNHNKSSFCLALMLTVILVAGFLPAGALAQCGGDHDSMHDQHMNMGSSGSMGSGQMGMYGGQSPNQTMATPVYNPPAPSVGSNDQQGTGTYGQMMGQGGGMDPSHSGHMGHNNR